jgi:hypothetical protein
MYSYLTLDIQELPDFGVHLRHWRIALGVGARAFGALLAKFFLAAVATRYHSSRYTRGGSIQAKPTFTN